MPQSVPAGLTREHVLKTLSELDAGLAHPFGAATGYELVHDQKRYAPKAVVGLACRYFIGRMLLPEEFSGGEGPGQANFVLRELGFTVVKKEEQIQELQTARDGSESGSKIELERLHRLDLWARLRNHGGPYGVPPAWLRELGVYGGAQGIWVDKQRTGKLVETGEGITVALLHTGSSYADDLGDDSLIYHYPQTNRVKARDISEIRATKNTATLGLPIFVISYPTLNSTKRDVRLGWVESWDDESKTFLITFQELQPVRQLIDEATPFLLTSSNNESRREVKIRTGQQRFKFQVFQRYGPRCAVCGLSVSKLLEAAHIRPKQEDGSDDPRNGLVFCANHHRAFDAGFFAVEPETKAIHCLENGPSRVDLGIVYDSILHLPLQPHQDALVWYWDAWES